MKTKTVETRRVKRAKNEGNSSYARKRTLQRKGVFSSKSPFSLAE